MIAHTLQTQEDSAGVVHYAEFEPGCTAPVRQWTEMPWDKENQGKGVIKMTQKPEIGGVAIYHDSRGVAHNALVTAVWSPTMINVVVVSKDENRQDDCGRQTERVTSVGHKDNPGTTHGRYFRFADEEANEYVAPVAV